MEFSLGLDISKWITSASQTRGKPIRRAMWAECRTRQPDQITIDGVNGVERAQLDLVAAYEPPSSLFALNGKTELIDEIPDLLGKVQFVPPGSDYAAVLAIRLYAGTELLDELLRTHRDGGRLPTRVTLSMFAKGDDSGSDLFTWDTSKSATLWVTDYDLLTDARPWLR